MIIGIILVIGFVIVVAGKLLLLQRDVGDYAAYWEQRTNRAVEPNSLLYVALGDSTAQGLGASHPELGYVGLVSDALHQKYARPVHVVNLSKSGAKVADALRDQVPRLAELKPDVVTMEIGANDLKTWNETDFERDMASILKVLPKRTVISDMPYFGGGRLQDLEPTAERATTIIRALATNNGLKVAPLHQITKDKDSLFTYAIDLFHPGNRGYRNWFEAFWSVLKDR